MPPVDDSDAIPISPRKLHVRVGLAFVQTLRPLLYALLVSSALLAFLAGEVGAGRRMPGWLVDAAPFAFGAFLIAFAVYRLKLMAAKRYPALLGFFQIGLGALVWVLLLPSQRQKMAVPQGDDVAALLASTDGRARSVAAEAAGGRGAEGRKYAPGLLALLDDVEPRVRASARAALARIAGQDVAPGADDVKAAVLWRAELSRRGWLKPPAQ